MKNDDVTHLMRAKHGLTQGLLITIASSLNVLLCDWLQDKIMTLGLAWEMIRSLLHHSSYQEHL